MYVYVYMYFPQKPVLCVNFNAHPLQRWWQAQPNQHRASFAACCGSPQRLACLQGNRFVHPASDVSAVPGHAVGGSLQWEQVGQSWPAEHREVARWVAWGTYSSPKLRWRLRAPRLGVCSLRCFSP